jgi:hypothetical protein
MEFRHPDIHQRAFPGAMGMKNGRASYNMLDLPDESEVPTSMNE